MLHWVNSTPLCLPLAPSALPAPPHSTALSRLTYDLLLTPHYSLLTTYCVLTVYYSLLRTAYYLLPTTYHVPRTTYHLPLTTHRSLLTAHYLLPVTDDLPCTTHHFLRTTYYTTHSPFNACYCMLPTHYPPPVGLPTDLSDFGVTLLNSSATCQWADVDFPQHPGLGDTGPLVSRSSTQYATS